MIRPGIHRAAFAILVFALLSPITWVDSAPLGRPAMESLALSGPFPIHQSVTVGIPSVSAQSPGSNGDNSVRYRAWLDQQSCDVWSTDEVHLFPSDVSPASDCDYAHKVERSYDGIMGAALVSAIDIRLPDDADGLPFSRYDGDQVRIRMDGTYHQDTFSSTVGNVFTPGDIGTGLVMGGVVAVFGPQSNFGGGGDPLAEETGSYSFDTCQPSSDACYSSELHVTVAPASVAPDRDVQISGVAADTDACRNEVPLTLGVSVVNREPTASQPYTVFVQELDPTTNARHGLFAYSAVQASLPSFNASVGIPITLTLSGRAREHHLTAWAYASGIDPGDMATAVEFNLNCRAFGPILPPELNSPPDSITPGLDPHRSPAEATDEPSREVPSIDRGLPTATSTVSPLAPEIRGIPTRTATPEPRAPRIPL